MHISYLTIASMATATAIPTPPADITRIHHGIVPATAIPADDLRHHATDEPAEQDPGGDRRGDHLTRRGHRAYAAHQRCGAYGGGTRRQEHR
jgi:hypothetical protein